MLPCRRQESIEQGRQHPYESVKITYSAEELADLDGFKRGKQVLECWNHPQQLLKPIEEVNLTGKPLEEDTKNSRHTLQWVGLHQHPRRHVGQPHRPEHLGDGTVQQRSKMHASWRAGHCSALMRKIHGMGASMYAETRLLRFVVLAFPAASVRANTWQRRLAISWSTSSGSIDKSTGESVLASRAGALVSVADMRIRQW